MTSLTDQLEAARRWFDYVEKQGRQWVTKGRWTEARLKQEVDALAAIVATLERQVLLEQVSNEILGRPTVQLEIV